MIRKARENFLDLLIRLENWLHCVRLLWNPLIRIASYEVSPPEESGRLTAGAHRIDITPPPGFPMGGSSIAARFGRGYWTRLCARAFFFRDASGQSAAFVSCDLNAIPGGLHARVGWLLRDDGLNLSPESLVLCATHVHHGPGNFFSYKVYNERGSPAPGFDERLFHWLADQIAEAVREAARDAQDAPAGTTTRLLLKRGKVPELLRNRAPEPFLLNADREEVIKAGPPPPPSPRDCPEPFSDYCPRFRAVDESLTVLEIHRGEAGDSKHIASLVFLSVHPEAMSHETALYQSDFTGLAMTTLEKRDGIVAGFFNGADGDISVRWTLQNRNEAVKFAGDLVWAIRGLNSGQPLDSNLRVLAARAEIQANPYFGSRSSGWCTKPPYSPERPKLCLAATPLFGVATVGGAEDARSSLFDLGWKPGVRREPREGQGVKVGAFESVLLPGINLTSFIAPGCYYPESFSVSLVSLSGTTPMSFSVLPAELTRTMWWRVRKDLEERFPSLGPVVPIGLANDYIAYVTTPEEYAAQGYEGASDIFGPSTGDVLRQVSCDLAKELHPPVTSRRRVAERRFYPDWRTESFGPEWLGVAYSDSDDGLEPLIVDDRDELDRHRKNVPYRHWPRFEWREPDTDLWGAAAKRWISIVREATGQVLEDEAAGNLLTVYRNPAAGDAAARMQLRPAHPGYILGGARHRPMKRARLDKDGSARWAAIWLWPAAADRTERLYFSVALGDGAQFCSVPFTINQVENRPSPVIEERACP